MSGHILLSSILNGMDRGIITTDKSGFINFMNSWTENEILHLMSSVENLHISEIFPDLSSVVETCIKNGTSTQYIEIKGLLNDLVAKIDPLTESKGCVGCVCYLERKDDVVRTARSIREFSLLSRQLQTIFNSSSDGMWVLDSQCKVVSLNPAAEQLSGIAVNEVLGKDIRELERDKTVHNAVTPEVLKLKKTVSRIQHVEKTGKDVLSTGTPVFNDLGEVDFVVVNERDMTYLNELQLKLEQSYKISNGYREKLAEFNRMELTKKHIIAESLQMKQLLETTWQLARTKASTILITGPSGTGKGLLAKFFHQIRSDYLNEHNKFLESNKSLEHPERLGVLNASTHSEGSESPHPFVSINCAALPNELLEAELFGYEPGAFTGADEKGKPGLFEMAHNGTLFLDEMGELPYAIQAKFLKCLEDRQIMRLGGLQAISIDCTVIAATNRDLERLSAEKKFRSDLYYRLNAFKLYIPALKDRPEDLFELTQHFLEKYNKRYNASKSFSSECMHILQTHLFPGNVRELKNFIKRVVVMGPDKALEKYFREQLSVPEKSEKKTSNQVNLDNWMEISLKDKLSEVERSILELARQELGTTRKIADQLGISQSGVARKLQKYGL